MQTVCTCRPPDPRAVSILSVLVLLLHISRAHLATKWLVPIATKWLVPISRHGAHRGEVRQPAELCHVRAAVRPDELHARLERRQLAPAALQAALRRDGRARHRVHGSHSAAGQMWPDCVANAEWVSTPAAGGKGKLHLRQPSTGCRVHAGDKGILGRNEGQLKGFRNHEVQRQHFCSTLWSSTYLGS